MITTKKVEREIKHRLTGCTGALEHYGDITGSNALGEHNIGIVLGARHYGDAPVEKWAALAGESVTRSGHGTTLDYDSTIGNTFLKHMREDETLQAILRFGRDEEGAVVFAHSAALADALPVVAEGAVVRAFSANNQAIMEAAAQYRGEGFTVSDVVDAVDVTKRTVRRVLNEHADLGYLTKHETKNGVANEFEARTDPGSGEVELPTLDDPFTPSGTPDRGGTNEDEDPDNSPITRLYTWNVRVNTDPATQTSRRQSARATLPAPEKIAAGQPPN